MFDNLPLTTKNRKLLCRFFIDPEFESEYAKNYRNLFSNNHIPWTITHITQSASDAANLLIDYVGVKDAYTSKMGRCMHRAVC